MKYKTVICLLMVLMLGVSALALPPAGRRAKEASNIGDTDQWIDVNKMLMFVTNEGSFAHQAANTLGKSDGLYFPFTSVEDIESGVNDRTSIFAAGVWLGAIDSTPGGVTEFDTLDVIAEFSNEYYPGPMVGGTYLDEGATDQQYRVYKLYRDSLKNNPNEDYLDYVEFAKEAPSNAPWDPVEEEVPIIGDQWTWCVYNDANPASKTNHSSPPLGVEIKQEIFGFDRENPLGNVLFMRFRLYNNGDKNLRQMYVSLWADPDLGGAGDDYVGCDTSLGLGYCYNADNQDTDYGSRPPAVGFDFFQGPLVDAPGETGMGWGFQEFPDFRNLGMTSFNKYINGTDPQEIRKAYWYMEGFDASGSAPVPLANGTKFFGAGDPRDNDDPDVDFAPDDRRWMQTTGPISFDPTDSIEIVAAVVIGQGADRLSSITAMQFIDQFAQEAFDDAFVVTQPPATPDVTLDVADQQVILSWTDTSETDAGDFPFEGYTVLQGPSASGPWTRLANYDLNNGITTILEIGLDQESGLILELPTKFGTDFGIIHRFETSEDALRGGTLNNLTDYFFRVEAYSYDQAENVTATSATVVRATPQQFGPSDVVPHPFGGTLPTSVSGTSGISVQPEVISPATLTGDSYRLTFADDPVISIDTFVFTNSVDITDTIYKYFDTLNVSWYLENTSASPVDTLLRRRTNFSGDEFSPEVDGILVRVTAADPLFFEVIANAAGPLASPDAGALNFQGFPTPDHLNPSGAQQVGTGHWAIIQSDSAGSPRFPADFTSFRAFSSNSGQNNPNLGDYDFEIRFTGSNTTPGTGGSYAIEYFGDSRSPVKPYEVTWVPFEVWNIGVGTPDDDTDDYRLLVYIIDEGNDDIFAIESFGVFPPDSGWVEDPDNEDDSIWVAIGGGLGDHKGSSASNDPFTDRFWVGEPLDRTPGQDGYVAAVAAMQADVNTYVANEALYRDGFVFSNITFVDWNGGSHEPFSQDAPEEGTVFRITSDKTPTAADVITWTATPRSFTDSGSESELDRIRAVPNPYYATSDYDNSVFERRMKFSNLPTQCTIKIFTLSGDLVTVIDRDNPDQTYEEWDVESSRGIPLASGIYIYVVEAPGFGTKIGKMAIFTEEEQLNNF